MLARLKAPLKRTLPGPLWRSMSWIRWRALRIIRNWRDLLACASFLFNWKVRVSFRQRLSIVRQLYSITFNVSSPHTNKEIISFITAILSLPRSGGVVVEAGSFKGIGTAKFSLAADIVGRELIVFDSFQGIPDNDEPHVENIFGGVARFSKGDYCGTLDEVKANVSRYGNIDCCRFVEGWFEDTLPGFHESVSAIYLDVDLASSTRTCLKYLYPLLEPGGALFSQDGHLPLVIDVFHDDEFWVNEVGCAKPKVFGIGRKKLIKIVKEKASGVRH